MTAAALQKKFKSLVKAHLPRGANLGPAVVQLFLNDGQRRTHVSLMNFPAFLAPQAAAEYVYRLRIYDRDGRVLRTQQIDLPRFGATDADLADVFGDALPAFGMIAVRIAPRRALYFGDRHLGRIRPHFYTLYTGPAMESLGLVHPQTSLDEPCAPERQWLSNLQLDPQRVRKLEVFQVNPSRQPLKSEVFLANAAGETLNKVEEVIPACGTRRAEFDLSAFAEKGEPVSVGLRGLAAANGKPILFMHFPDGSFTCCHG